MKNEDLTHEDLRKRAVKWLTGQHCGVVLSEMVSAAWETPDAIGWRAGYSMLVECKVSRADFFRNRDKHTLQRGGMGRERYFLVPPKLVRAEDMTIDFQGYGLLWAEPDRILLKVPAVPRDTDKDREIAMLTSALRRVKTREFLTIVREDRDA